jgi:hypothetical protein
MNQDELLQKYLEELEAGAPLKQILARLPDDQWELAPLLSLAVAARLSAQSASIHPLKAHSQQQRIIRAARQRANPPDVQATVPAPQRKSQGQNQPTGSHIPRSLWFLLSASAAMVVVFALVSVAAAAFLFQSAASARAATLMDVTGVVEVAPANNGADWTPVNDGEKLAAGERLRTRADSSATLVFYDGSRSTLSAETELVLSQVGGGWQILAGRGLKVRYQQVAGETTHSVVPLKGRSSFFEVLTPSGKASVHGTIFSVDVTSTGAALFAVDRGVVQVSQSDASVTLTAGQATLADGDNEPQPPSYQFSLQGLVQTIDGETWTVNGVSFRVDPALAQTLAFQVDDWVAVRGRIRSDGSYQADRIVWTHNQNEKLHFTGIVESIGTDTWTITRQTVQVDSETEIQDGIQVGDPVEVSYLLLPDGSKLAREIERLDDEADDNHPTGTPALTLTDTATLDPYISPSPSAYPVPATATPDTAPVAEATPTPESNRAGCEASGKQHPEGLRLAQRWGVPYEEIMGWFCQGFGFGEIDLAYDLALNAQQPVAGIFAMKSGGMGWGEIKQQILPKPDKKPVSPQDPNPTGEINPHKGPKNKN